MQTTLFLALNVLCAFFALDAIATDANINVCNLEQLQNVLTPMYKTSANWASCAEAVGFALASDTYLPPTDFTPAAFETFKATSSCKAGYEQAKVVYGRISPVCQIVVQSTNAGPVSISTNMRAAVPWSSLTLSMYQLIYGVVPTATSKPSNATSTNSSRTNKSDSNQATSAPNGQSSAPAILAIATTTLVAMAIAAF